MSSPPKKPPHFGKLNIDPSKIPPESSAKRAVVVCRVTSEERQEIASMANTLGVSISEYLRQLHRQAVASIRKEK